MKPRAKASVKAKAKGAPKATPKRSPQFATPQQRAVKRPRA